MRIVIVAASAPAATSSMVSPTAPRLSWGSRLAVAQPGQPVVLLEANLDDATGETLAHAVQALLEVGALDAWITPVVMKKGRPGHTVSALVDPALIESVRHVLRSETGSLGVRATSQERWPATRAMAEVDVEGVAVRVKVSPGRVKVEHADAARVAARTGLPLREVVVRAEAAWRRRVDADSTDSTDSTDITAYRADRHRSPTEPPDGPSPCVARPSHSSPPPVVECAGSAGTVAVCQDHHRQRRSHRPIPTTGPTRSGWPGSRRPTSTRPPTSNPVPVWRPGEAIPSAVSSAPPCSDCAMRSTDRRQRGGHRPGCGWRSPQ